MKVKTKITYYLDKDEAKKIKIYCLNNNTSQIEIAKKLGISKGMFAMLMNGTRPIPKGKVDEIKELLK